MDKSTRMHAPMIPSYPVSNIRDPENPHVTIARPRSLTNLVVDNYDRSLSKKLGIVELVGSGLVILLNVIGILLNIEISSDKYGAPWIFGWPITLAYYLACGIWCTICVIPCGIYALCAASKNTYGRIRGHRMTSILAVTFAFIIFGTAVWALGRDIHRLKKGFHYQKRHYRPYNEGGSYYTDEYEEKLIIPSVGLLVTSTLYLLVSIVMLVACIWSVVCTGVVSWLMKCEYNERRVQYLSNTQPLVQQPQCQTVIVDSEGRPISGARVVQYPGYTQPPGEQISMQPLSRRSHEASEMAQPPPPYQPDWQRA